MYTEKLRNYIIDTIAFMQIIFIIHKRILCENVNAIMLDLDFGTYLYITSSLAFIDEMCIDLDIPSQRISKTIDVVKVYIIHIDADSFLIELLNIHTLIISFLIIEN